MTEPTTTRRQVLHGIAGFGLGGVAAGLAQGDSAPLAGADETSEKTEPAGVPVHGSTQAGIVRPGTPQPHGSLAVLDLAQTVTAAELLTICAALGRLITALTTATDPPRPNLPDGPGDLTMHVGLGPRLVRLADRHLPGATALPRFLGDTALDSQHTGGDLLVAAYSHDPNDAHAALTEVTSAVGPERIRWSQRAFRAPGTGTVARNPLRFHDGVIVPRSEGELAENVWISDGPAAGGTIAVLRRLRLDLAAFSALAVPEQEQVIGRQHATGAPLSGGGPMGEVDLLAKTPEGEFRTPARSHVRAAHPSFTGSRLMLRRSYSFDDGRTPDGTPDSGLLFVSFQRDLDTFVKTQHRLEEVDDLMDYVTVTASASFLILPGFDQHRPLGATLA